MMYGVPLDGSKKPFLMCILDGPGQPAERAAEIWRQTAHLYTQKLASYFLAESSLCRQRRSTAGPHGPPAQSNVDLPPDSAEVIAGLPVLLAA
jgi:hypothetical protein